METQSYFSRYHTVQHVTNIGTWNVCKSRGMAIGEVGIQHEWLRGRTPNCFFWLVEESHGDSRLDSFAIAYPAPAKPNLYVHRVLKHKHVIFRVSSRFPFQSREAFLLVMSLCMCTLVFPWQHQHCVCAKMRACPVVRNLCGKVPSASAMFARLYVPSRQRTCASVAPAMSTLLLSHVP